MGLRVDAVLLNSLMLMNGRICQPTEEKIGGKGSVVPDSDADHYHNEDEASGDAQEATR